MIGNTMKKAILIPVIVLGLMSSAKADMTSCAQADYYGRMAEKRIDFANQLRVMRQPFQDEIDIAKVWQDKQAQAASKCSATDRDYHETIR
jgi:hypothetical protein